jgi:hypothetical protein
MPTYRSEIWGQMHNQPSAINERGLGNTRLFFSVGADKDEMDQLDNDTIISFDC